jgi:bcr-type benzoyl-CoA reductase subunit C
MKQRFRRDMMIEEFKERYERRHDQARKYKKEGKKIIACFYGSIPKELIHAAGMIPMQLIEDRNSQYEQKSNYLPYLCGLSKNLAGQIYDKVFDYVDGVMVSTVCDTNRHVYDIWAHEKVFPHQWLVRAPATISEAALTFFTKELRRLADELGQLSGQKVTEDTLLESIALYNENRALFQEFYDMRLKADISGEDALCVFGSALVTPVDEHNAMMKRLLSSFTPSTEGNQETRLMLCALNLNMSLDVIRMVNRYGGKVVTDDFTHNARYGSNRIETNGDPFSALAKGYLRRIPIPGLYSIEDRATYIRDLMKRANAEGMIYLIQLYCDAYSLEYGVLKHRFDEWKLPHLKIEAEDTPSSIEQLNARIQSFLEFLL